MATTHMVSELSAFVRPTPPLREELARLLVVLLQLLVQWTPIVLDWVYWRCYDLTNLWLMDGINSWFETTLHLRFWLVWLPSSIYFWAWVGSRILIWFVFPLVKQLWLRVGRHTVLGWLLELLAAAVYRALRVPPPVAKVERANDPSVSWGPYMRTSGRMFAEANKVTFASVSAGGLTASRLRKRATWVRKVEEYLGGRPGVVGKLIKGRWTPDLPSESRTLSANVLLGLIDTDAKLLGGGVLPTSEEPTASHFVVDLQHRKTWPELVPFFVVDTGGVRRILVPELVSKLASYACFRPRNEDLLAGLRSRAREWIREKKVHELVMASILPDAVELTFSQTAPERLARERLDALGVLPPSA